ncbi:MAG: 4Fe-4S dicluster domain-containing protein, partial [Acidobacteriota bacterium]|nr:4Fe-4S dicluster domain-containing protein [Acidobacteriota bacterium]
PDSVTKLTWDNAALVGVATAKAIGVKHGQMLRVEHGGHSLELPVYILPGQAPETIGVALGYGRRHGGQIATDAGFDAYPLRTREAMAWAAVQVQPMAGSFKLATTQNHWAIDPIGTDTTEERVPILVHEIDIKDLHGGHDDHGEGGGGHGSHEVNLWQPHEYEGYKWGMTIDLNDCTGCNVCIVACQSENNIPVVGRDEVIRGREMHWIRVDRYFQGDADAPSISFQPVTCHHCENAPCEQVCPVAATVHDAEGLNVMVYNRCIGTRYCANNCPYKVRRFNYFNNHLDQSPMETMIYNPQVSKRSRGVMEKCTFCTQRIAAAKITAGNEDRKIRDGEVVPACAQACPTRAITFGDLNDEGSRVLAKQKDPRAYAMLEELNVRPRLRYLSRVRNPGHSEAGHGAGEA